MRTTVTIDIDDDVLVAAKALAARKGSSLGEAISELARRGIQSLTPGRDERDATVFTVAADAKPITSEDVYRALTSRDGNNGNGTCENDTSDSKSSTTT